MLWTRKTAIWRQLYFSLFLLLLQPFKQRDKSIANAVLWHNPNANLNEIENDNMKLVPLTLINRNFASNIDQFDRDYDNNRNEPAINPLINYPDDKRLVIVRRSSNSKPIASKYDYLSDETPSCEALKVMWNYSRRRARAAELTNEIPNYNQHFLSNNMPAKVNRAVLRHTSSGSERSSGGSSSGTSPYGNSRLPVFGRVLNRELILPPSTALGYHQLQPYSRGEGINGASYRGYPMERRPGAVHRRYAGASGGTIGESGSLKGSQFSRSSSKKQDTTGQSILGSFQKVKQLIWNERANEQTQHRQDQDLALKAYALRHLAQGEK